MATPLIEVGEDASAVGNGAPHVLVTVNGPGEIAAWLYPFAHALRQAHPHATLTAAILPCAFASGCEHSVLADMPGLDRVFSPLETMRWIVHGTRPMNVGHRPDVTLHLGGELALSLALARRARTPIASYAEERARWPSLVDRVCVRDRDAVGDRPHERVRIVGNLMVDAARLRVPRRHTRRDSFVIALLPGSRPYFVQQVLPLFLRAMAMLTRRHRAIRFVLAKSDFVSVEVVADSLRPGTDRVVRGDDGALDVEDGQTCIRTASGLSVDVLTPPEALAIADIAITIPGTNTAELAALGIPMLLVLPTYRLRALPLPGIAGHLGNVPVLGGLVKELVARTYIRTRRFWAHPNILAGCAIVPELVGHVTAERIADAADALIDTPLDALQQRLRMTMGSPGAASRLVHELVSLVEEAA